MDITHSVAVDLYSLAGYKPANIKIKTVEEKIKAFKDWMQEAAESMDKIMIYPSDFLKIQRVVEEVMNNPYTKKVFKDHSVQVELY